MSSSNSDLLRSISAVRPGRTAQIKRNASVSRRRVAEVLNNGPTPERRQHMVEALAAFLETVNGKTVQPTGALRITSVCDAMLRRGQITQVEHQAAEKLYADFQRGMKGSVGLTQNYGERTGGSSSPAWQHDADTMDPAERRSFYHRRFMNACRSLGNLLLVESMLRTVCEIGALGETKQCTLADIGRDLLGYQQEAQCQAGGAVVIKIALEIIARFYGLAPSTEPTISNLASAMN
jgi:hypothetical protein